MPQTIPVQTYTLDTAGNVVPTSDGDGDGTGAYTEPTLTTPIAGVSTGTILAANVNRLYALFVNDSDSIVYLALGVAAVLNAGIRLSANGGSYEMSQKFGNLYTGVVNGISGQADKIVLVTEGV